MAQIILTLMFKLDFEFQNTKESFAGMPLMN